MLFLEFDLVICLALYFRFQYGKIGKDIKKLQYFTEHSDISATMNVHMNI